MQTAFSGLQGNPGSTVEWIRPRVRSQFSAPRGAGPYGIASLPDGSVYYASLANHHIARINPQDGSATVLGLTHTTARFAPGLGRFIRQNLGE